MVNQQSQILVVLLVVNFGFDRGYLREVTFVNDAKQILYFPTLKPLFFSSVVFHCDEVLCYCNLFTFIKKVLLNLDATFEWGL